MCKLDVNIHETERKYPIFINNVDLDCFMQSILQKLENKNFIIVISQKVYKLYSKILQLPKDKVFILKDGEAQKNINNYTKIINFALSKRLTRDDAIIAIGGGVVGDLAGFVASTYMRGISYIQVPTTLLACTDSSVGGKTAINTAYGKNMIGSFYQPNAVFINVNFLKTLDERQYKSGLGEVVKYGFIEKSCPLDEELNLFNFFNENFAKILSRDVLVLREMIEICIKMKISVVTKDEKEAGLRKILNLGHTYAHAIEKITNYKKYTHGECVVAGILYAIELAYALNKIDKEYKFLCQDLIKKFEFFPLKQYPIAQIFNLMQTDKKSEKDKIIYVLPTNYAQVECFKFEYDELYSTMTSISS